MPPARIMLYQADPEKRCRIQYQMDAHNIKDISRFQAPVKRELEALEGDFREALVSDIPIIREIANALAEAPGKRIRPNILFLASRSAGGSPEKAAAAGLAVELIHTATLLHDDFLDGHMTRRGKATIYARWGSDAALIMGDFLYSKAFSRLGEEGLDSAMEVLARVTHLMSIGEMIQLQHRRDINVSEEGYMELIYRKTASLFAAASECGTLTGGSPGSHRCEFASFGENIGLAFQITDDLFDFIGADVRIGKPIASDFTEGRVTLPFITAFRNAPEASRRRVSEIFHGGFEGDEHWEEVVSFIRDYGGIAYCLQKARELGEKAKSALKSLSPSREKDALFYAADYIIERVSPFAA
jgi:octaprenyl-diphosphate synthase